MKKTAENILQIRLKQLTLPSLPYNPLYEDRRTVQVQIGQRQCNGKKHSTQAGFFLSLAEKKLYGTIKKG